MCNLIYTSLYSFCAEQIYFNLLLGVFISLFSTHNVPHRRFTATSMCKHWPCLWLGHVTMVCAVCLGMFHYGDVIMRAMASQITSLTIVYSAVYSCVDQRKHQSSASLAFVRGIHRWPVNSPRKRPVTRKMFPFDDVIMLKIHVKQDVLTWPLVRWCLLWQRTNRRGFFQYKYVVLPGMNFHCEGKTVIGKICIQYHTRTVKLQGNMSSLFSNFANLNVGVPGEHYDDQRQVRQVFCEAKWYPWVTMYRHI